MSKHKNTDELLAHVVVLLERILKRVESIEGQMEDLNDAKPSLDIEEDDSGKIPVPSPEPAPH